MRYRSPGLASVAALGVALGGCVAAPTYPLMTPIQVAQTFGYSEKPLADNQYEVSYVTPPRQAVGYRFDASPTEDASKTMAFDLATLRAAEIAQSGGWKGFDIVDRHSSTDDQNIGPYWDGAWGPGWGWGRGWGFHHHWGFWGDEGWWYPPEQRVQAEVVLTIKLTNTPKPSDLVAADVIARVGAAYPGVMAPPPAAQPPAPPAKPSA